MTTIIVPVGAPVWAYSGERLSVPEEIWTEAEAQPEVDRFEFTRGGRRWSVRGQDVRQVRRYTASNKQTATWRRQSLRAAFDTHTAYTAYEQAVVTGCLHAIVVPSRCGGQPERVVWDPVRDEFYCATDHMHACEHSGAAMVHLMARGLLPYMDSHEPAEVEANARVWREANS
jgi:hypothetical protein